MLGLSQSPPDSGKNDSPGFTVFFLTFSLGIAQLSKYNCHMLIHFGRDGIPWLNSHAGGLWLGRLCRPRLEVLAQTSSSASEQYRLEAKSALMSLGLHSMSGNYSLLKSALNRADPVFYFMDSYTAFFFFFFLTILMFLLESDLRSG